MAAKQVVRDRIRGGKLLKGAVDDLYKEYVFDASKVDLNISLDIEIHTPVIADQRISKEKAFNELMSI